MVGREIEELSATHLEVCGEAYSHSLCCSSAALMADLDSPDSSHVKSLSLAGWYMGEVCTCTTTILTV